MNVFERLQDTVTGMKMPDDFRRRAVAVSSDERKTGEVRPYTLDANEEHELSLTLVATYWANQAQTWDARKTAERTLAHLLYGNVLAKLQMIEHAISDGDARAAFLYCGELRKECTP